MVLRRSRCSTQIHLVRLLRLNTAGSLAWHDELGTKRLFVAYDRNEGRGLGRDARCWNTAPWGYTWLRDCWPPENNVRLFDPNDRQYLAFLG